MNFFLEHWKELSILGAISIPLIGLFTSTSKAIEWTKPFGYYTQARLFIENGTPSPQLAITSSTGNKLADLLAEFPLRYLEKENWWKYCLPKGSKLSEQPTQATASVSSEREDCDLSWWNPSSGKHKNPENISYLLRLMLKFLQLQNQLNLIFLFFSDKSTNNSAQITQVNSGGGTQDWSEKIKEKCKVPKDSYRDAFLKNLFTSSIPISKNCLITPIKVEVTLNLDSSGEQVSQASSGITYSLEKLKKGTITGEIHYSLTDYWGKLHDFQFDSSKQSPASFKVINSGSYKFKTNGQTTQQENENLDFNKLFDKYQKRELRLEDFNCRRANK